jgi:apolipoprotein N-acyltransferase
LQLEFLPVVQIVVDAYLHGRMAALRGVENGFTVVHVAQEGLLYITDAYGRVLAEQQSFSAPEVMFVHAAPAGPGTTLYARFGDWFGVAAILASIGLIVAAAITRNRQAT